MLVVFDKGTPRTLARYLIDHHAVTEARARGWRVVPVRSTVLKASFEIQGWLLNRAKRTFHDHKCNSKY
jgi:hypothetical protein